MAPLLKFLTDDARSLGEALVALGVATTVFGVLALIVKPRTWLADAKAASGETRINLILSLIDDLTVTPLLGVFMAWIGVLIRTHGLQLDAPHVWDAIGRGPTLLLTVFVGDFIGYWRHRAQHSRWLWPAHAIHHSDTRMTWLTLERMHPVDRFGSAMDTVILGALGFPLWAMAANVMVRHYYGYVIHADLPFTWRKAGWVLNSPVMHRWHHARDVEGSGSNFATVFSVFDRAFGTYYQPGVCDAPLGVNENMGKGALGQYLHPFKAWWAALRPGRKAAVLPAE